MALIECPECGWEVSDTAAACPKCAYRLGAGTLPVTGGVGEESGIQRWWPTASVLGRLGVGACLLFLARVEQELGAPTGILGLLVAGSAIPAWYRHKLARLQAGSIDTALEDRLEDRLLDQERRHLEQLADLEERLEFTERLLTKQREQIGPG